MKSVFIAASVLVASLALATLDAAPPPTTSPATAPADKEWKVPDRIHSGHDIRHIIPAGDVVFFTGWAETVFDAVFKLDTKTGVCTNVADLLPDSANSQKAVVTGIDVAPDAKHAVISCTMPSSESVTNAMRAEISKPCGSATSSPSGLSTALYLLELGKVKAVEVADFSYERNEKSRVRVMWKDKDTFFVSGYDKERKLTRPTLYDTSGKKVGGYSVSVLVLGASDDGKMVLAQEDPAKLNEPFSMEETPKVLVMDQNGKVLRALDGRPAGPPSHNGKYVAIREPAPTTQQTTGRYRTISVVSTDGEQDDKRVLEAARGVTAVQVGDTGELLGIEWHPGWGFGGTLTRWNQDRKKVTLMEGVSDAAVQGETLYYLLGKQPNVLKAVKLSKLK